MSSGQTKEQIEEQLNLTAQAGADAMAAAREPLSDQEASECQEDALVADDEDGDGAYLVRGAKLYCTCGSHIRKANLTKCHGVYVGENPILHEKDCNVGEEENITWFGICTADGASNLSEDDVCFELTEENNVNRQVGKAGPGKKCQPDVKTSWQNVYAATKIADTLTNDPEILENCNAITTKSYLVCSLGGVIQPLTSGQEYVMTIDDLDENKNVKDGKNIRNDLWDEIKEARESGVSACGEEDCFMAHERHPKDDPDSDLDLKGNIHGEGYITVVFQYEDGEIIDVQHVKKGEPATAPDNIRVPEGYIFEGWDGNYDNVQQDLILNPVYSLDIDYAFNQITDITDWMKRGYNDEKIQTAKLLFIHIMNDEELCELGADLPWVCGVLASMSMEGIPGLFEGNSPYDYLKNANTHGYDKYKDDYGKILLNFYDVKIIDEILNCNKHDKCGFGFGMFQWTFSRTVNVWNMYVSEYGHYTNETDRLSFEQRFEVEWAYFKKEITSTHKLAITEYIANRTGDIEKDAMEAGRIFRSIFEVSKDPKSLAMAEDYALHWLKELQERGIKELK